MNIVILEGAREAHVYGEPNLWDNKIRMPNDLQQKTNGNPCFWVDKWNGKLCFGSNNHYIALNISEIIACQSVASGQDPDRGNRSTSTDLYISTNENKIILIFTASVDFDYKLGEIHKTTGISIYPSDGDTGYLIDNQGMV